MTPEQFAAIYPHLMGWIQQVLSASLAQAKSVASKGFKRLPYYFSERTLSDTKVVIVEKVPMPPLSQLGLMEFSGFENDNYSGITYLDTFFATADCANDEGLYFHELVHVIQWRTLGPQKFIETYAYGLTKNGYRNSPLEVMAYDLESKFRQSEQVFNAEDNIVAQLSAGA